MLFSLLTAETIKIAPIAMAAIEKTTSATAIKESSSSEIAIAAAAHTREFAIYVAVGILAAVIVAFLTWRVWKSGNRLQDAIRHDANARIEEAQRDLKKLEVESLKLKSELANAQERAARAQKDLIAFKDHLFTPRSFDRDAGKRILDSGPKGSAGIWYVPYDKEVFMLTSNLRDLLKASGWTISEPELVTTRLSFIGITLEVGGSSINEKDLPRHISSLHNALTASLKTVQSIAIVAKPDLPEGSLVIFVGHRI
jgi:hypothetical protein